jgi:hypothetical protein
VCQGDKQVGEGEDEGDERLKLQKFIIYMYENSTMMPTKNCLKGWGGRKVAKKK